MDSSFLWRGQAVKSDIMKVCEEAAREASRFLKENFRTELTVEHKIDSSLATNLDREAEDMIVHRIRRQFSGAKIIAEERESGQPDDVDTFWIIDPLDGTHNFIRGIRLFGVSIGVLRAGEFIAGAIAIPMEETLFLAERGSGATCNGERIFVNDIHSLSEATIAFDSSLYQNPAVMTSTLSRLTDRAFNLRIFGSSARVLSFLADGTIDGTVEYHDKIWDFAGGIAIAREAGALVTDISGGPFSMNSTGYIASSPGIHSELVDTVLDA